MSEQDQDRTEKATPHKLEEARKRGETSKSADVSSVTMLSVFTVMVLASAGDISAALEQTFRMVIPSAASITINEHNLLPWLAWVSRPVVNAISPMLIALSIAAALGTLLQTGIVFSTHPVKPDFSRLNPAQGMKKFFRLRILFELFKTSVKLGLVGIFLSVATGWLLADVLQLSVLSPAVLPARTLTLFAMIAFALIAIFVVIAVLDLGFSKFEFARRMRMSRRDLKDEHKKREGDPELKAKRKQLQQEMRKRASAVARVPEADLVLVNPTHIAIALQYRSARMRAPEIRALGAGRLAKAIRDKARDCNIPVIHNRALARLIYASGKLDHPVPDNCFEQLAPIYQWLISQPNSRVSAT